MTYVFSSFLCLVQFFVLPALASPDRAAKLILIACGSMLFLLLCRGRYYFTWFHACLVGFVTLSFLLAIPARIPVESVRFSSALFPFFVLSIAATQINYQDNRLLLKFSRCLLVSGLIAAILGLYEYVHFYLMGPSRGMLIPFLMPPDATLRVGGNFGQPNLFALILLLTLISFIYVYLHDTEMASSRRGTYLRFLPVMLVSLVFFLTGSRAGSVALVTVFALLLLLTMRRKYLSGDTVQRKELLLIMACIACGYFLARYLPAFLSFLNGGGATTISARLFTAGIDARFVLWGSAWLMFVSSPLLGVGPDNFKFFLAETQVRAHDLLGFVEYESFGYGYWAHNEILQLIAEMGLFGLLFILLFVGALLRVTIGIFRRGAAGENLQCFYCLLLLVPFLVQAEFSWPLRHPGLLSIFVVLLGILFSRAVIWQVNFSVGARRVMILLGLVWFSAWIFYGTKEYREGQFLARLERSPNPNLELSVFESFADNAYSRFRVTLRALPVLAEYVIEHEDRALAIRVLPYMQDLAWTNGSFWQWYYLARLAHLAGDTSLAKEAVQKSIDLQPVYGPSWKFQHLLNVEGAAVKTGRPLEEFLPKADFNFNETLQKMVNEAKKQKSAEKSLMSRER